MTFDSPEVKFTPRGKKVKEVESSLARHLKEQQKLLGDKSVRSCPEILVFS
jgi:hypothetical protein